MSSCWRCGHGKPLPDPALVRLSRGARGVGVLQKSPSLHFCPDGDGVRRRKVSPLHPGSFWSGRCVHKGRLRTDSERNNVYHVRWCWRQEAPGPCRAAWGSPGWSGGRRWEGEQCSARASTGVFKGKEGQDRANRAGLAGVNKSAGLGL